MSNINVPISLYKLKQVIKLLPVCVPGSASRVSERYNVHFFVFLLCSPPLTGIALVWFASSCTVRSFHYESELRGTGNQLLLLLCCATAGCNSCGEHSCRLSSARRYRLPVVHSLTRTKWQIIKDLLNRRLHQEENSRVPIASSSPLYLFCAF